MKRALKGINLGGWLVLEKWITPSLFKNTTATDEYTLCSELGTQKSHLRLEKHRKNFITSADFKWLKEQGIEALRVPVGYWIFGDEKPYSSCIEYLDFAFEQAEKLNLKIIVDMHGATGSQNGKQHSGHKGSVDWDKDNNQAKTLLTIEKLAKRYKDSPSLFGIELLNEPDRDISYDELKRFYEAGYEIVRTHCEEDVAVIISDQFRPLRWRKGLGKNYRKVILDVHLYQIFGRGDKKRSYTQQIQAVKYVWGLLIWIIQQSTPVIIGEWSAVSNKMKRYHTNEYMNVQKQTFASAQAWFYWTYKTENGGAWSYKDTTMEDNNRSI